MTSKYIPSGDPRQQIQQKQPDLSLGTDVVCENCGNLTFQEVLLFRAISALVSPQGKAGIVPSPTFACVACGHVNQMFRPPYMLNEEPVVEPTAPEAPKSSLILEK